MVKIENLTAAERLGDSGPFDIIGDIHGCYDELLLLLDQLGYEVEGDPAKPKASSPSGRRLVFLGDLADRGPACPAVLRMAMNTVESGDALCVMGNHDFKLWRKLLGKTADLSWGLAETLEQLDAEDEEFKRSLAAFIATLPSHYVLDRGALVIAHAGLSEGLHGKSSRRAHAFCLYGDSTGQVDEQGFPIRRDWAAEYSGEAMVVYGHTPVDEARWVNNTINLDTACVYGGSLTALRYPERELVQVPARMAYYSRTEERIAAARARES